MSTTPQSPSPEAVAAAVEICQGAHRELYVARFRPRTGMTHLRADASIESLEQHYARLCQRHFAPIIAKAELCDRLAAALKRRIEWEGQMAPMVIEDYLYRESAEIDKQCTDALADYAAAIAPPADKDGRKET